MAHSVISHVQDLSPRSCRVLGMGSVVVVPKASGYATATQDTVVRTAVYCVQEMQTPIFALSLAPALWARACALVLPTELVGTAACRAPLPPRTTSSATGVVCVTMVRRGLEPVCVTCSIVGLRVISPAKVPRLHVVGTAFVRRLVTALASLISWVGIGTEQPVTHARRSGMVLSVLISVTGAPMGCSAAVTERARSPHASVIPAVTTDFGSGRCVRSVLRAITDHHVRPSVQVERATLATVVGAAPTG